VDPASEALARLLDMLSERTFLNDRAGDHRLIDAYLADWPVRSSAPAPAHAG
jgi:hypothetical protein